MATVGVKYDTVEKYVDWGDSTVTVDPIDREFWIHEGGDTRHYEASQVHKAQKAEAVRHTLGVLRTTGNPAVKTYLPSVTDVTPRPTGRTARPGYAPTAEHGVAAPFDHHNTYRGAVISDSRPGQRPIIEQMHIDGRLADTPRFEMDQRNLNERARTQLRLFDQSIF